MIEKARHSDVPNPVEAPGFAALGLTETLTQALEEEGYRVPTPIQKQAIPLVLQERDLVACAQTGTGKTAAFVLPLLQLLGKAQGRPRALILTPTRELALQVGERARAYGRHLGLGQVVIYGGVSQQRQERELRRRPDLVVATPGRLLDLMRQGFVSLKELEILVLDEADTMLDMGFIHDIRRVIRELPEKRQTLLFSATLPSAIQKLVREVTRTPTHVSVDRQSTPAERVSQSVFFVEHHDKRALLQSLVRDDALKRVLVFTRTKHGANRLAQQLSREGIDAAAIHGNKSQSARERALAGFKSGRTPVLVATDVAARGIDVQGVALVVNFELPNVPECYVHRIGRTGRAGASGKAVSFCSAEEQSLLRGIERLMRRRIDVAEHAGTPAPSLRPAPAPARGPERSARTSPSSGAAPRSGVNRNKSRRRRPRSFAPSRV